MKKLRLFAGMTLAVGMLAAGTMSASAAQYRNVDYHEQARVSELRREIAADQSRLDRDRRMGNWRAVERDRQELARDQRELAKTSRQGRAGEFGFGANPR